VVKATADAYFVRFPPHDYLLAHDGDLAAQLPAAIRSSTECDLEIAFTRLMDMQVQPPGFSDSIPPGCWRGHKWIGVDRDFIMAEFQALGSTRCAAIAESLLRIASSEFGRGGWPDLTCIEGNELEMIEVKTTDRLLPTQIATIPRIMGEFQIPVRIVQVEWT
jgi:hypothetical protein